jgi:AcrR family transcriptional regulator
MATDTRTRILEAATRLFSSADSRGASLRAIAREADVNSALVHYHFGSRENLFEAAILGALTPIQERRRSLIEGLLASCPRPEPRDLARLFVEPLVGEAGGDPSQQASRLRLLARVFSENRSWVQDLTLKHFGELMYALGDFLGTALPELPVETKYHRMQFSVEVALESLASFEERALASPESVEPARERVVHDLIDFLAGGLAAPVSSKRSSRPASRTT